METALRKMQWDGGVPDGKGVLPDDVFATATGRSTTPHPKYSFKHVTKKDIRSNNKWVIDNAIAEAVSRGDDWNADNFRKEDHSNLPQCSVESMLEYLFGDKF
jgi:hypothetical protein